MVGIPGFNFTSQKTSVNAQQDQDLTFNPQISIQSTNPILEPSISGITDQNSSQPQSDSTSFPLGLESLGSLFGRSGSGIQSNIPNDTSIQGVQTAGIGGDSLPLLLMAGGLFLVFMFVGKKKG